MLMLGYWGNIHARYSPDSHDYYFASTSCGRGYKLYRCSLLSDNIVGLYGGFKMELLENILAKKVASIFASDGYINSRELFYFYLITGTSDVRLDRLGTEVDRLININWDESILCQDILLKYVNAYNETDAAGIQYEFAHNCLCNPYNASTVIERICEFAQFMGKNYVWESNTHRFVHNGLDGDFATKVNMWSENQLRYFSANRLKGTVAIHANAIHPFGGCIDVITDIETLDNISLGDVKLEYYHLRDTEFCERVDDVYNLWKQSDEKFIVDTILFHDKNGLEAQLIEMIQHYSYWHKNDLSKLHKVADYYEVSKDMVNYWVMEANNEQGV